MVRIPSRFAMKEWPPRGALIGPNGGYMMRDASPEGKEFMSEADLRRYCKAEGLESQAIL